MFFLPMGASLQIDPGESVGGVLRSLPPVWFMGFNERELGWSQPAFVELAATAWRALAIAAAVGGLACVVSYRRSITYAFAQGERPSSAPGRLRLATEASLNRLGLPHSGRTSHTSLRSGHYHPEPQPLSPGSDLRWSRLRARLPKRCGHGGLRNRTWRQNPQGPLLPSAVVSALFVLAFLHYAFSVPAQWRANWAFQIAGGAGDAGYLTGVRKAVALLVIVPLFAVLLPIHVSLRGWTGGTLHVAFGLLVAWLLMEVMLVGMEKTPFTCSYVAGKANLRASWPLYVRGYLAYLSACTWAEYHTQQRPETLWIPTIFVLPVKLAVGRYRPTGHRPPPAIRRRP